MERQGDLAEQLKNEPDVFSVSDLNRAIKQQLESEFPLIWVKGELSNFTAHRSGHWYFSLKDQNSQIMAVMFKGHNGRLKFKPKAGDEVLVRARLAVYEPRGNYQIVCEIMDPVGAGALQQEFEQLKAKLASEGLFEQARKQALPSFPKKIAVLTSPTGAAIRDILNVLGRRNSGLEIHVFPCRVQGDQAAKEVRGQVEAANSIGDYDVIIVGRGGGSIEDLWCFNDEALAREISASAIPIVSAVGHEIDFTISDFVADLRAPTPSAAAELVTANSAETLEKLKKLKESLWRSWLVCFKAKSHQLSSLQRLLPKPSQSLDKLIQKLDDLTWRLESLTGARIHMNQQKIEQLRLKLISPGEAIERQKTRQKLLDERLLEKKMFLISTKLGQVQACDSLALLTGRKFEALRVRLEKGMAQLGSLSPLNVLERGYSITRKQGLSVKSKTEVESGDKLEITLHEGSLSVSVEEVR